MRTALNMYANSISLFRILLTFVFVGLFGHRRALDLVLIPTVAVIFVLDAVDGLVARHRNETSAWGAILDTVADRVIENTFWLYFSATGQLPLWMPIAVMSRGILTDSLHRLHGAPARGWRHALTRSRISRALYGLGKLLTFLCLACAQVFDTARLGRLSVVLAVVTVVCCLLRGLPLCLGRTTAVAEQK